MASLVDFDFTGDDGGPDTDPTPFDISNEMSPDTVSSDGIQDDATNYVEPGVGDTFAGQDPTVFAAEGDPDEPESQTSDTPPLEAEQQTATYNDPKNLGEKDDPESQEQVGDQQAGDVEDDTADPADVDSSGTVDSADDIAHQEQGIDNDEVTAKEPERTVESAEWTPLEVGPGLESRKAEARYQQLTDLYKGLLNKPEDLGLLIDKLLQAKADFEGVPRTPQADLFTPERSLPILDDDTTFNYVLDLASQYDVYTEMLGDDFFRDLFEAETDSTLAFSILEPDEVSQEFTETFWPNDEDILLDLQDFVDVPETSAMTVSMSDFFDTAQPPQLYESVAAILPEIEIGIFYDV